MRATDMAQAQCSAKMSKHEIDEIHKLFKAATWQSTEEGELLLDATALNP